ncbi:MAG: TetR/AcrR family transcriptional regulator [Ignavibacteriaceae bacterium]|nr:TetR/AcrR family transcriptional regulator [Ignavibacteriaceae bacterium]
MTHIERKQREKEEIRQNIINAAIKIAANEGWHSVTIRKIADMIEYTPPIVYEYFENKDDLMKEIVYVGFDILNVGFESARKNEINSKEFLKAISLRQWNFAKENRELFQLMFSLERVVPNEKMKRQFELIEKCFHELAKNDEELVMEYMTNWVCLIQGAISVLLMLKLPPPKDRTIDEEAFFIKMIERFLNSIE